MLSATPAGQLILIPGARDQLIHTLTLVAQHRSPIPPRGN